MTEMFGEAWPPMSVPDLAPDDDDDDDRLKKETCSIGSQGSRRSLKKNILRNE